MQEGLGWCHSPPSPHLHPLPAERGVLHFLRAAQRTRRRSPYRKHSHRHGEAQMSFGVPPGASCVFSSSTNAHPDPVRGDRSGNESCSHLMEKSTSASFSLFICPPIVPWLGFFFDVPHMLDLRIVRFCSNRSVERAHFKQLSQVCVGSPGCVVLCDLTLMCLDCLLILEIMDS